ncbi:MAG: D-xylose-proton symporter [Chlamydiia bacterium]|nr:D-xylose-proton symporter [Chlamydiia bacterium]
MAKKELDMGLLGRIGLSPQQMVILFVVTLGSFLLGYHAAVISGVMLFLQNVFAFTIPQIENLVSGLVLGSIAGIVLSGLLSDRIGRFWTISLSTLAYVLSGFALVFATGFFQLYMGRFLAGVGFGIVLVLIPMYLSEVMGERGRGFALAIHQLMIILGVISSYAVNYLVSDFNGWRISFLAGLIVALVQLALLFLLPESPRWLKGIGLKTRAPWSLLFSKKMRIPMLIGIFMNLFHQFTGINVYIFFGPLIYKAGGHLTQSAALDVTLYLGVFNLIPNLLAIYLISNFNRKPLLYIGGMGLVLANCISALAYFFAPSITIVMLVIGTAMMLASFSFSFGPITWLLSAEVFPSNIRGRAMSIAILFNSFAGYLVGRFTISIFYTIGFSTTFTCLALFSMAAVIFAYNFVPETKDKSLEEIELELSGLDVDNQSENR